MPESEPPSSTESWLDPDQPSPSFLGQIREHRGYLRGALVLAVLAGGISLAQRGNHQSQMGATLPTSPSPLVPFMGLRPAIAYDVKRQEVVLFNNAGQTWIWSGKQWKLAHPPVSPPTRCCTTAAWDPKMGQVLLFGGDALES